MNRIRILLAGSLALLFAVAAVIALLRVGCDEGGEIGLQENTVVAEGAVHQRLPRIPSWALRNHVDYPTEDERQSALAEAVVGEKDGFVSPALPGNDLRVNRDPTTRDQEETSIAVNPADPDHLVAVWNDPYNVNWVQFATIGYAWSRDGGRSWQSSRLDFPGLFPPEDSMCDPSVTFDAAGNVYIGIMNMGPSVGIPDTAYGMWISKSTDGGETFQPPVQVDDGVDKPYVTFSPLDADLYFVYEKDESGYPNPESFRIHFSKSSDAGATWSTPVIVNNVDSWGNGSLARPGPGGEIYVVWSNIMQGDRVYFDRSLDGGVTWMAVDVVVDPSMVAPATPLNGGFRNPNVASMQVDLTGGPYHGRIYIVAGDGRNGDPDIHLYWSDDHGDTWNGPVRVNDDAVGNGADQWFPWIEVDDDGTVHVSFLDRRNDHENYLYAAYLATSTDGGQSFGPNIRVSSGFFGPTRNGFVGDYTGLAVSGSKLYPFWPDGRYGDLDVFTRAVDRLDFDEDGILNDGDADGQYANHPCTAGQTVSCDDNCPGYPNADQADSDGDGVGDACDNCPLDANAGRLDSDRDGIGDACDACPGQFGGDDGDPDGDGVGSCDDNCPVDANADQNDGDGDGIGDVCDLCPGSDLNDQDGDGFCEGEDNCPDRFNPAQFDGDGDGAGEICDVCPGLSDPAQTDTDQDLRGDACDCQPYDGADRVAMAVRGLRAFKSGSAAFYSWERTWGGDLYSAVRGDMSELSSGSYGTCFTNGVDDTGFGDTDVPDPGEGFFYLVQGQNFDCGMGTLGHDSAEAERFASGACSGAEFSDHYAVSEHTSTGTRSGSLTDTQASDDVYESLTEGPTGMARMLNHTWTFDVTPGASRVWFHVEGFHAESPEEEAFTFLYRAPGEDLAFASLYLPTPDDPQRDLSKRFPGDLSGAVEVQIVDQYINFGEAEDTARIDQLWIRTVP